MALVAGVGAVGTAAFVGLALPACTEGATAPAVALVEADASGVVSPDAGTASDAGASPDGGASVARWSARAPLPQSMQEVGVVSLDGLVYVLGGFDDAGNVLAAVRVYDPVADRWRDAAPLPRPLHHVNAAVAGGRLWITGALERSDFTATGSTLVFDPASDAWSARTPMPPGSERGSSMTASIGRTIYVAGGLRGGAVLDFSAYDTEADTWTSLPALPTARDHGGGVAAGGLFYAVSGRSGLAGHTTRLDVFDPATGRWSSRAGMPTSRAGSAIVLVDGAIVVLGGEGNARAPSGVFAEVEAYDLARDRWTALPPMPTPRHGTGAAAVDGVVYVPGGGTRQGFGAVATLEALRLR